MSREQGLGFSLLRTRLGSGARKVGFLGVRRQNGARENGIDMDADGADQPRVASLVLPFVAIALLALKGRRWAGANRLGAPGDLRPQHLTQRRTLGVTAAITSKLRPHATGG